MRNLTTTLFIAATVLWSSSALAIFDAQVLVGQRSGKLKPSSGDETDLKGTEIQAAFHVDPIPLIPIGFGIYASQQTYEQDATSNFKYTKMTGLEGGVQLYAWFPLSIKSLKPYAKLGYPVFSAIKADAKETIGTEDIGYSAVFETSGPHINFGVSYKPLPVVPLFVLLEVDLGQQKIKSKDIETGAGWPDGTPTPSEVEYDYNSTAIMFGVEVGL